VRVRRVRHQGRPDGTQPVVTGAETALQKSWCNQGIYNAFCRSATENAPARVLVQSRGSSHGGQG
jgi:hypothetical protein